MEKSPGNGGRRKPALWRLRDVGHTMKRSHHTRKDRNTDALAHPNPRSQFRGDRGHLPGRLLGVPASAAAAPAGDGVRGGLARRLDPTGYRGGEARAPDSAKDDSPPAARNYDADRHGSTGSHAAAAGPPPAGVGAGPPGSRASGQCSGAASRERRPLRIANAVPGASLSAAGRGESHDSNRE